jgi:hypothetical protein
MPMNRLVNMMDARMKKAMKNTLLDTLPVAEMTRLIVLPQLSFTRICIPPPAQIKNTRKRALPTKCPEARGAHARS